jgi:hypothetical protein
MNRSALMMILPLLVGCNVHSKSPAESGDKVAIQADEGGNVAFNLPFVQGQVKVPSRMMHNGNFDIDGVKLMPGSSVTGVSVFAADKGSTVNMAFTAPASPDAVRSYFVDQFKQKGVEAALAGDVVTGKTKDGSPYTIQVGQAPGGSQGKIVIQSKD